MSLSRTERFCIPVIHGWKGKGLVESIFFKFNLGTSAFWVRHTFRKGKEKDEVATAGVWAIWNDGEGKHVAGCNSFPFHATEASNRRFYLRIGKSEISMGKAKGEVFCENGMRLAWDISFDVGCQSLVHFPFEAMYSLPFPKNKILSPLVSSRFSGAVEVGSNRIEVRRASGMLGHNYGETVAPTWAWAHTSEFDDEEGAVFEAVSSRLKIGRFLSPPMTIIFLKLRGKEYLLNSPISWLLNSSSISGFEWRFSGRSKKTTIWGVCRADPSLCVGLGYVSTDSRVVPCVNSNLADLEIVVSSPDAPRHVIRATRKATLELGGTLAPSQVPLMVQG